MQHPLVVWSGKSAQSLSWLNYLCSIMSYLNSLWCLFCFVVLLLYFYHITLCSLQILQSKQQVAFPFHLRLHQTQVGNLKLQIKTTILYKRNLEYD